MADTREQTRRQRAEARERRRELLTQPFETLDEKTEQAAETVGAGRGGEVSPLAKTAVAAAAAAAAGGLAGAAKAVIERRNRGEGDSSGEPDDEPTAAADEAEHEAEPEEPEAEAEPEEPEARSDSEEPEAESEPEPDDEDEPSAEAEETTDEAEAAEENDDEDEPEADDAGAAGAAAGHDEPEADAEDEPGEKSEDEADEQPDASENGGSRGDLRRAIASAREQLQELVGSEPESVSSLEQVDGGWKVTLEVVEMRRVPDSTDVLCSYDVVVGSGGDIVSLDRARRYRRAQVDGE